MANNKGKEGKRGMGVNSLAEEEGRKNSFTGHLLRI